eukprot:gene20882-biopygen4113
MQGHVGVFPAPVQGCLGHCAEPGGVCNGQEKHKAHSSPPLVSCSGLFRAWQTCSWAHMSSTWHTDMAPGAPSAGMW